MGGRVARFLRCLSGLSFQRIPHRMIRDTSGQDRILAPAAGQPPPQAAADRRRHRRGAAAGLGRAHPRPLARLRTVGQRRAPAPGRSPPRHPGPRRRGAGPHGRSGQPDPLRTGSRHRDAAGAGRRRDQAGPDPGRDRQPRAAQPPGAGAVDPGQPRGRSAPRRARRPARPIDRAQAARPGRHRPHRGDARPRTQPARLRRRRGVAGRSRPRPGLGEEGRHRPDPRQA